jgi:hypothetical protein
MRAQIRRHRNIYSTLHGMHNYTDIIHGANCIVAHVFGSTYIQRKTWFAKPRSTVGIPKHYSWSTAQQWSSVDEMQYGEEENGPLETRPVKNSECKNNHTHENKISTTVFLFLVQDLLNPNICSMWRQKKDSSSWSFMVLVKGKKKGSMTSV